MILDDPVIFFSVKTTMFAGFTDTNSVEWPCWSKPAYCRILDHSPSENSKFLIYHLRFHTIYRSCWTATEWCYSCHRFNIDDVSKISLVHSSLKPEFLLRKGLLQNSQRTILHVPFWNFGCFCCHLFLKLRYESSLIKTA